MSLILRAHESRTEAALPWPATQAGFNPAFPVNRCQNRFSTGLAGSRYEFHE